MRIQAWTPNFTPEEETPIVPIWMAIPGLPWHCYNKVLLTTILDSIGKVLLLNSPFSQRTRGSTLRVKVQVDLTKTRPNYFWQGFKNANANKGRWLKVEYEDILIIAPIENIKDIWMRIVQLREVMRVKKEERAGN